MTHPIQQRTPGRLARTAAVSLAMTVIAASCGGSSDPEETGGVVIRDISVDTVDGSDITADEPTDGGAGADDSDGPDDSGADEQVTTTTLPQTEQLSPQDELFEAVAVFQSCLAAEGTEFIGTPDPSLGADAPQNQQPYIDSLVLCAARSDIQNKVAASQAAQANLTPEEIEEQNRAFLVFRDCMIGRGWIIPDPVPNENGLLFSLAGTQEWEAPDGESLIDSDDTAECTEAAGVEQDG